MPNIPLFRYDPPVPPATLNATGVAPQSPPVPGTVSLTPAGAAGVVGLVVALLGASQPWVTAWMAADQQKREEETRVRSERITREIAWLKSALAVENRDERDIALKFLVKAKLVEDLDGVLKNLDAAEIPYLAPTATPSTGPQDIQNTSPPAPGAVRRPR